MITFTGVDTIFISNSSKSQYDNSAEPIFDFTYRADSSVVATLYVRISGSIYDKAETQYTAAAVNAYGSSETDPTEVMNDIIHNLEKDRLEALNPSATFTITL